MGSLVLALPIFPVRLQTSIFGRIELNFRVRNGNGWTLDLINTNYRTALSTVTIIAGVFLNVKNFFSFLKKLVTRAGIEPTFAA